MVLRNVLPRTPVGGASTERTRRRLVADGIVQRKDFFVRAQRLAASLQSPGHSRACP
jgi:hypothetical protein